MFTDSIISSLSTFVNNNLSHKTKIRYNSSTNYLYQNFFQNTGRDGDWAWVLKSSKSFNISLPETVEGTLSLSLYASSFDDTIRVYRNNIMITDIHSYAKSDGYAPISNYSWNKSFSLDKDNTIEVRIYNSGAVYYMNNLTFTYSYYWITN